MKVRFSVTTRFDHDMEVDVNEEEFLEWKGDSDSTLHEYIEQLIDCPDHQIVLPEGSEAGGEFLDYELRAVRDAASDQETSNLLDWQGKVVHTWTRGM